MFRDQSTSKHTVKEIDKETIPQLISEIYESLQIDSVLSDYSHEVRHTLARYIAEAAVVASRVLGVEAMTTKIQSRRDSWIEKVRKNIYKKRHIGYNARTDTLSYIEFNRKRIRDIAMQLKRALDPANLVFRDLNLYSIRSQITSTVGHEYFHKYIAQRYAITKRKTFDVARTKETDFESYLNDRGETACRLFGNKLSANIDPEGNQKVMVFALALKEVLEGEYDLFKKNRG